MSANTGWIDFRALRNRLDFLKVLDHYKVKLKVKGRQATGFCPLPTHQGKKNSPSFSVNLEKKIFQCFGCGAKGNVIDFACLMQGRDPKRGEDVHDVAMELEHRFVGKQTDTAVTAKEASALKPFADLPAVVNPPLDFELKDLNPEHPYLRDRGFMIETVKHFGLGYCSRGMLQGRIAIPLHDAEGKLVGYAGRLVDDKAISEENPKYRFPTDRERKDKVLEFRKSLLLYNAHRIVSPVDALLVVEGFPATWWLHQHGYCHTVAVMGSSCSPDQGKLIVERVKPSGVVLVFTDGNIAGKSCAASIFFEVGPHRLVRYLRLNEAEQPTDLTGDELQALIDGA